MDVQSQVFVQPDEIVFNDSGNESIFLTDESGEFIEFQDPEQNETETVYQMEDYEEEIHEPTYNSEDYETVLNLPQIEELQNDVIMLSDGGSSVDQGSEAQEDTGDGGQGEINYSEVLLRIEKHLEDLKTEVRFLDEDLNLRSQEIHGNSSTIMVVSCSIFGLMAIYIIFSKVF